MEKAIIYNNLKFFFKLLHFYLKLIQNTLFYFLNLKKFFFIDFHEQFQFQTSCGSQSNKSQ